MPDLTMEREERGGLDRRPTLRDGSRRSNRPAAALGYLSLGLGLTGLIFTRGLGRLIGLRQRRARQITRAVGARELITGVRLLASRRPARWLWARVAGDIVDLSLLGAGLRTSRRHRGRVLTAMAAIGGVTAIDLMVAIRARTTPALAPRPIRRAATIAVPPEQVYAFWRDPENLPSFMNRVVSVEPFEARRSHWRARGPAGTLLEWDAEMIEDLPSSSIRWRSLPGSVIRHQGSVRFRPAPGLRGTEVSLEIEYEAPAGELGRLLSSLTREAVAIHIENNLRRLKQILEVGEVVCSDASAHRGLHPARPESAAKLVQKDGEP